MKDNKFHTKRNFNDQFVEDTQQQSLPILFPLCGMGYNRKLSIFDSKKNIEVRHESHTVY